LIHDLQSTGANGVLLSIGRCWPVTCFFSNVG